MSEGGANRARRAKAGAAAKGKLSLGKKFVWLVVGLMMLAPAAIWLDHWFGECLEDFGGCLKDNLSGWWQLTTVLGAVVAGAALYFARGAYLASRASLEVAREDAERSKLVSAWQIIATRAPGNSGKKEAIEALVELGKDLHGIDLSRETHRGAVYLVGLRAAGAYLYKANLSGANLEEADLRGANLMHADLRKANLWGAGLQGANLWEADLQGAELRYAELQGAVLKGADMRGSMLSGAELPGADLSSAQFDEHTNFAHVKLDGELGMAFAEARRPPQGLPEHLLKKVEMLEFEEYMGRQSEINERIKAMLDREAEQDEA